MTCSSVCLLVIVRLGYLFVIFILFLCSLSVTCAWNTNKIVMIMMIMMMMVIIIIVIINFFIPLALNSLVNAAL